MCAKEVSVVGWWETVGGRIIGDAPAEYIEELAHIGQIFVDPSEFPWHVRERLEAFYLGGLGRKPTNEELMELLGFCR